MVPESIRPTSSGIQALFIILGILFGLAVGLLVFQTQDTLTLLVLVIGIIAFMVSVARVDWGLIVLAFILYTNFSDVAIVYHNAPSIAKWFAVILLFAIVMRWLSFGEQLLSWQKPTVLMTGYGLIVIGSILYAADPTRAQAAVELYIKNALIVIVFVIVLQNGKLLRQVIWALLGAGIFLGTLSVYQYLTGTFSNFYFGFAQQRVDLILGTTSTNRIGGPLGDPNYYALIMAALIPFALDRIWNEKKSFMRIMAIWALVVCILSVLFTYSRSGFATMAVVICLMFIYRTPNLRNMLIMLIIALIVLQFIPSKYDDRLGSLGSFFPWSERDSQQDQSFRGRTSEVLVGWKMFLDNPVLGVGYDNYPVYYQEYSRQVGLDPRSTERSAHNLYIEILSETGILGLITFGLLVWIALRDLVRSMKLLTENNKRELAGISVALVTIIIGYLFAYLFIHDSYQRYFWVFIGLAFAVPQIAKSELSSLKKNGLTILG